MNALPSFNQRIQLGQCLRAATLAAGMLLTATHAAELLRNPSFDDPAGLHWNVAPNPPSDPFAVAGQVDLSRNDFPRTILWQTLDIPNVESIHGTASMTLQKPSGPPAGESIKVYVDYLDDADSPQRLALLTPDNGSIGAGPTYFSASFQMPANASRVTGLSIDKDYGGLFQAMDFSLTLDLPAVTVTSPVDGTTTPTGTPLTLSATVEPAGRTITCVEFYSGDTLIGQAQPSVYGEWTYADGSHLSVMEGWQAGMVFVDYQPPTTEQMYTMDGTLPTALSFSGQYTHFVDGGGMLVGPCSITFSFNADGTLNADINGTAPLGVRELDGGAPNESQVHYTLNWADPPAGSHSITARACYGTDLWVTSAPVQVTVGSTAIVPPPLAIHRASASEVELSWPDTGTSWQLESRLSLTSGSWTPVAGVPTLADGRYSIRLGMSGVACFYHLRSP